MTAVEWLTQHLSKLGLPFMATLCGHGLDPLFQAARRAGLRLVDTRNEQTASYLCEAYGKLTRLPGVCAVSSGVAHVNALAGVANAWFDGAPMMLISGAGPLRTAGTGHFQDMDQVSLAHPIARYARVIDQPDRVLFDFDEAIKAAVGPPPGPVHLTFPMDVQTTEVREDDLLKPSPDSESPASPSGDPLEIARLLEQASRPLIVAGNAVYYQSAEQDLLGFSREFAIPMVTPIWDRGCVAGSCETFLGVIGAASGGPRLLADADCILMAGARFDYRVGYRQPSAIRVDGWRLLHDAYRSTGGKKHADWLAECRRRRDEFRSGVEARAAEQAKAGVHAIDIIDALRQVLTDETVLLIDGGSIGQWAHQLLCSDRYPGHWLTCGASGVVGWGVGGAMGARLAFPDRPVILLSGDGAFTFNVADLECAVRQSLPFVAIVADDLGWGITRTGHVRQFGEAISSSLGPIAFDRLAESLGARGVRVTAREQIAPAIRQAVDAGEVTVIHVPIVGGNP